MAYKHLGNENKEPNKDVVMPHRAPTIIIQATQCKPASAKAPGRAASGSMSEYGTISVNAALTNIYTAIILKTQL